MAAANVTHELRAILRLVNRYVTKVGGNRMWHDFVLAEFRAHRAVPAAEAVILLQRAQDYALSLRSIQEHKDLLMSYNISTSKDEQQKRLVQQTATRVGMQLPVIYEGK